MDTHNFRKASVTNCSDIAESGHASVFSDTSANLPDRSEAAFRVANGTATEIGRASSSPWLHQDASFLMELNKFIY